MCQLMCLIPVPCVCVCVCICGTVCVYVCVWDFFIFLFFLVPFSCPLFLLFLLSLVASIYSSIPPHVSFVFLPIFPFPFSFLCLYTNASLDNRKRLTNTTNKQRNTLIKPMEKRNGKTI